MTRPKLCGSAAAERGAMFQHSLFATKSTWQCPQEFPSLDGDVAVDCETKDPLLKIKAPGYVKGGIGHIIGVSVATDTFKGYYPVRHEGGGNLDAKMVFNWLRQEMAKPTRKIFANANYDIGWLATEGIHPAGEIHDVQVMAPLLDEHRFQYSLDSLAETYLGFGKDTKILEQAARDHKIIDYMSKLYLFPANVVGPYAERDAEATLALFRIFEPMIVADRLQQVYLLERQVQPIILEMRQRGLRVDIERAHRTIAEFKKKEKEANDKIKHATGLRINANSAIELAKAFDQIGIKYGRTAENQPSITAEFLDKLDHPLGAIIRQARKYEKAYGTFIEKYILNRHINGRLFAQFNQLKGDDGGTVGGRFSSSDPNLQNIPARDPDIGPAVRSLFLPEEGEEWMAADYANQEPRLQVHYAALLDLEGTEAALKRYAEDPAISYHKIVQEMIEPFLPKKLPEGVTPYKVAKTINLGKAYGMGGPKLCRSLGLPTKVIPHWQTGEPTEVAGDEGQLILDQYDKAVPFTKKISSIAQFRAKSQGFITTFGGRRCRFPKTGNGSGNERKALNRLIQGSAADQTKKAMVDLHKNGHLILLTMHDENAISVKSREEVQECRYIMEHAIELKVPSICDVDVGPSWGEATLVKDIHEGVDLPKT